MFSRLTYFIYLSIAFFLLALLSIAIFIVSYRAKKHAMLQTMLAKTACQMSEIACKYNLLLLGGQLKQYPNIADYLKQSSLYLELFFSTGGSDGELRIGITGDVDRAKKLLNELKDAPDEIKLLTNQTANLINDLLVALYPKKAYKKKAIKRILMIIVKLLDIFVLFLSSVERISRSITSRDRIERIGQRKSYFNDLETYTKNESMVIQSI